MRVSTASRILASALLACGCSDCTSGSCPTGVVACGATCADLRSDPENCGSCGNRCRGGACAGGACTQEFLTRADVLFVVDDSGSMMGEQAAVAAAFPSFLAAFDEANVARAEAGLALVTLHVAVTTTSVFWNPSSGDTCSSSCNGAAGQLVCCTPGGMPATRAKRCASDADCGGGSVPTTCGTGCDGFAGESYCCNQADGTFPDGAVTETIPCYRADTGCGRLLTHYAFGSCSAGVAVDQWPFPAGDFVSWTSGSGANPRVLHFDAELYAGGANRQGFTRAQLLDFFRGGANVQGNVIVGTCGSGEEQALEAARLAIAKVISGRQRDTFARSGAGSPAAPQQTWDPVTRTAGSPADFLPADVNSKLVLVFVGDEDDCSSAPDPSLGVVMLAEPAGADACTRDAYTQPPLGQKELPVDRLVTYLTSLGRPVAAGFILPAAEPSCSLETCTPGICCDTACTGSPLVCTDAMCGAQAPGTRLLAAASQLAAAGAQVVVGSVCDPDYGTILSDIGAIALP